MIRTPSRFCAGLLAVGSLAVLGPVRAQDDGGWNTNPPEWLQGERILFPESQGNFRQPIGSGTVASQVITRTMHPVTSVIRRPNELAAFLDNEEEAARLLTNGLTSAGQTPAVVPRLGPQGCMLVGVHLGSKGSEGYTVQIQKIRRIPQPQGLPAIVEVQYKITAPGTPGQSNAQPGRIGPGRINVAGPGQGGGGEAASGALTQQTSAPAHLVRIPYLPDPDRIRFIDVDAETRMAGLDAIALMVSGDTALEMSVRVNKVGHVWVKYGEETREAEALLTEMMRLGEAVKQAKPQDLIKQFGSQDVPAPVMGNLSHNTQFNLMTWNGRATSQLKGSWEGVMQRLEPVRQALQLIKLRLEGKIDVERLEQIAGQLGVSALEIQVGQNLSVRVDEFGIVQTKKGSGQLRDEELAHLAYVIEQTNPMSLEEKYYELPPQQRSIGGQFDYGANWTFHLRVDKDGQRRELAGNMSAAPPQVHALYHAVELVASRIERRPAEITGVVELDNDRLRLRDHYLTLFVNQVEGNQVGQAIREKLTEWVGRQVVILAAARLTSREGGEIVPTGKVLYPQRKKVTGLVGQQGGLSLQYMEAGMQPTNLVMRLQGPRAGSLVGSLVGRFVLVDVYLFYDQNLLPSEAFVEALGAMVSRREKYTFGLRNNEDYTVQLFDRPSRGGAFRGVIYAAPDGVDFLWVTDRQGGFSFIPERNGWAEEDDKVVRLSERKRDVDDKVGNSTGFGDVFMQVLRDMIGAKDQ